MADLNDIIARLNHIGPDRHIAIADAIVALREFAVLAGRYAFLKRAVDGVVADMERVTRFQKGYENPGVDVAGIRQWRSTLVGPDTPRGAGCSTDHADEICCDCLEPGELTPWASELPGEDGELICPACRAEREAAPMAHDVPNESDFRDDHCGGDEPHDGILDQQERADFAGDEWEPGAEDML